MTDNEMQELKDTGLILGKSLLKSLNELEQLKKENDRLKYELATRNNKLTIKITKTEEKDFYRYVATIQGNLGLNEGLQRCYIQETIDKCWLDMEYEGAIIEKLKNRLLNEVLSRNIVYEFKIHNLNSTNN